MGAIGGGDWECNDLVRHEIGGAFVHRTLFLVYKGKFIS